MFAYQSSTGKKTKLMYKTGRARTTFKNIKSTNADTLVSSTRSLSEHRTDNYLFCIWFDRGKREEISRAAVILDMS